MEAVTRDAGADETTGTATNALVGAAVTVLSATVVPLAPLLGGGVAGYLRAGKAGDGLLVGALAGGVAVPVLLVLVALLVLPIYRAVGGTTGLGGWRFSWRPARGTSSAWAPSAATSAATSPTTVVTPGGR